MRYLSETGKKITPEILFLALFSVFLHLLFINNLEYHRDELLYFSLGLHPDAGYATVPPLIGWVACIMQNIFGYSVFAVRLFPALLSGGMILIAGAISKEMGGGRYASFLAALGLMISIFFMRSFLLFQPVHIEIFLWTLCVFLLIKYVNTQSGKYLILFGIIAGLSLLNKYLATLFLGGLLVIVPFTEHRIVFRKKMFWFGILAGFLIFLPNLLWQAINGFPVIRHMSELYDTQLVYMDIPLFLTEQLIMPFAGTLFTVAGLIFLLTNKEIRRFRFLGFLAIVVIGGLMLLKGKSYYTLGIFPLLIVSGATAFERWIRISWLKVLFPLLLVLITIPVVPIGLPVFGKDGLKEYFKTLDEKYGIDLGRRFEDGSIHSLPQDYADMLGWDELTALANKAWQMVPDKKSAFIYCENYGQAGAITIIGKKYGLPEAVSFHESFRYWIPTEFNPDITSFIYINDELGEDVNQLFGKITKVGSISDPDAREYGTTVYLCQEPVMSFNRFWKERLQKIDN
jgi:hypothetical protein